MTWGWPMLHRPVHLDRASAAFQTALLAAGTGPRHAARAARIPAPTLHMSTDHPIQTQPRRDAWPAVRGFIYQVDQSILAWTKMQDGERLYLELGEDYAIQQSDAASLLALVQVKHLVSNIGLHSAPVVEAILNLAGHRDRNPGVPIALDFLTTAGVAREQGSTLAEPGLVAWQRIASGASDSAKLLAGVSNLLRAATTERKQDLDALLTNNGAGLAALIPLLRWRTAQPPSADLEAQVREQLGREGFVAEGDTAEAVHDALFSFVFRRLADPGRPHLEHGDIAVALADRRSPLRRMVLEHAQRLALVEAALKFDPELDIPDIESVHRRTRVASFTGRTALISTIDTFAAGQGLLVVEARAGGGKSSLLAHLQHTRGWPAHFAELDRTTQATLRSLAAQIAVAYGDDKWFQLVRHRHLDTPSKFWPALGGLARRNGRPIVVILDALDEMDQEETLLEGAAITQGVVCIGTRRPGAANPDARVCPIDEAINRGDIAAALRRRTDTEPLRSQLAGRGWSADAFMRTLLPRVGTNWKFADAVVGAVERGEPLDLATLPTELVDWYRSWWQRWRRANEGTWDRNDLPLLAVLATTAEPLPALALADLSGAADTLVTRRLRTDWVAYLVVDGRGRARLDHHSFREFLRGEWAATPENSGANTLQAELRAAAGASNRRILDWYLNAWGGLDAGLPNLRNEAGTAVHDGYGVRHLVWHARQADPSVLARILSLEWTVGGAPRGALEVVRSSMGDAPLYRDDLLHCWASARGWRQATREMLRMLGLENDAYALPGPTEVRHAVALSSVGARRAAIPPTLTLLAFRSGAWTLDQALAHVRRQQPADRAMGLALLAAEPGVDRESLASQALAALREVREGVEEFPIINRLARVLVEPHRAELLTNAWKNAINLVGHGPAVALLPLGEVLTPDERDRLVARAAKAPGPHCAAVLRWIRPGGERDRLLNRAIHSDLNSPLIVWIGSLRAVIPAIEAREFLRVLNERGACDEIEASGTASEAWSSLLARLPPRDAARWLATPEELPAAARNILIARAAITDAAGLIAAAAEESAQERIRTAFAHLSWLSTTARADAARYLLSRLDPPPDPREFVPTLDALAEVDAPPLELIEQLLRVSPMIGDAADLDEARCALAWALPSLRRTELREQAWQRAAAEDWPDASAVRCIARQAHGLQGAEREEVMARLLSSLEEEPLNDAEVLGALLLGGGPPHPDAVALAVRRLTQDRMGPAWDAAFCVPRLPRKALAGLAKRMDGVDDLEEPVEIVLVLARSRLPRADARTVQAGLGRWDADPRAVIAATLLASAPPRQRSVLLAQSDRFLDQTETVSAALLASVLLAEATVDPQRLADAQRRAEEWTSGWMSLSARAILARLDPPNARRWWGEAMHLATLHPNELDSTILLSELLRVPADQASTALEALLTVLSETERPRTAELLGAVGPWLAHIGARDFAGSLVDALDQAERWWP